MPARPGSLRVAAGAALLPPRPQSPSGDREFSADGQLAFEIDDGDDGDLNPDLIVNGTLDAYTTVPAGPVRLRLLNGSQARVYELSVSNGSMVKIASDGGYLAAPVPLDTLTLGPGDRAEIMVDTADGPATLVGADFGRVLALRTDPSLPAGQPPAPELASTRPSPSGTPNAGP